MNHIGDAADHVDSVEHENSLRAVWHGDREQRRLPCMPIVLSDLAQRSMDSSMCLYVVDLPMKSKATAFGRESAICVDSVVA